MQPTHDQVRQTITGLAEARGDSLAALSAMLGRNPAYLHQYVNRGTPERLHEDDRLMLAQHFGISERALGARDPWEP